MKKAVLTLFIMGLVYTATAQVETPSMPYDSTQKKIIYTEVVKVEGSTKDQLYDRAMAVLPSMIKEVNNKMSVKDKAAGKIEIKCSTRTVLKDPKNGLMVPMDDYIKYTLTLLFKDGKYKYEIKGFNTDLGGHPYYIEHWYLHDYTEKKEDRANEKLAYLDKDVRSLIAKLKDGLAHDKVEQKSDW